MTIWKEKRSPTSFLAIYSQVTEVALKHPEKPVEMPFQRPLTLHEARGYAREMRYWRWCIRNDPDYYLHQAEMLNKIGTRILPHIDEDGRPTGEGYRIAVVVKPRLYQFVVGV
jgi:hypothetical protein